MKRIAIMLLFSVVAAGQSSVVTLPEPSKPIDCDVYRLVDGKWKCEFTYQLGHEQELYDEADKLIELKQRTNLQLRVLAEFSLMELELKQLNDKRVNRVIERHLAEIEKLVVQMKQLDEEK